MEQCPLPSSAWPLNQVKPMIIFLLGPPGAGKGTQSAYLTEVFPALTHISYGDLMRQMSQDPDSEVSRLPTKPGTNNPVVPDAMGARLLRDAILSSMQAEHMAFLIDGFPRRAEHVSEWRKLGLSARCVIHLSCPTNVSQERIQGRAAESGRPEDASTLITRGRLDTYEDGRAALLQALRECGMHVVEIDASKELGAVKEEVRKCVQACWQGGGTEMAGDGADQPLELMPNNKNDDRV